MGTELEEAVDPAAREDGGTGEFLSVWQTWANGVCGGGAGNGVPLADVPTLYQAVGDVGIGVGEVLRDGG
jgi:hypothetical protein